MAQAIQLPTPTRERLEALIRSQQETQRVIEATVQAVRESLEIPDDWTISDVRVGFVGPEKEETPG